MEKSGHKWLDNPVLFTRQWALYTREFRRFVCEDPAEPFGKKVDPLGWVEGQEYQKNKTHHLHAVIGNEGESVSISAYFEI